MGALQDNKAVYWISVVERIAAVALIGSFGTVWRGMATMEFTTLIILATSIIITGR